MSNLGIFLTGAVVTMLVVGALLLLLWGAVMDGRQNDASDGSVEGGAVSRMDAQVDVAPGAAA